MSSESTAKKIKPFIEQAIKDLREESRRLAPAYDMYTQRYNALPNQGADGLSWSIKNSARDLGAVYNPGYGELADKSSDKPGGSGTEAAELFGAIDNAVAILVPNLLGVTISTSIPAYSEASDLRQELIRQLFVNEDLVTKAREAVVNAMLTGRGVFKVGWDDEEQTPKIESLDPSHVYWDTAARSWDKISWVVHIQAKHRDEIRALTKSQKNPSGMFKATAEESLKWEAHPEWLRGYESSSTDAVKVLDKPRLTGPKPTPENECKDWTVVIEYWDLFHGKLYYYNEGKEGKGYILYESELPYSLVRNPFVPLVFNYNTKNTLGLSDAMLAMPSLRQVSELGTARVQHAKAATPVAIMNKALVENHEEFENDLRKAKAEGSGLVKVQGNNNIPANMILGFTQSPTITPDFTVALNDARTTASSILALPGYARGQESRTDVATELALQDASTATIFDKRQGILYKSLKTIANYCLKLYAEFLQDRKVSDPLAIIMASKFTDSAASSIVHVTRSKLKFLPLRKGESRGKMRVTDQSLFNFDVSVFQGDERNAATELKKLQLALPLLNNNPNVEQAGLTKVLLRSLGMEHLFVKPTAPAPPPGSAQAGLDPNAPQLGADPSQVPLIGGAAGGTQVQAEQVSPASLTQEMGNSDATGI